MKRAVFTSDILPAALNEEARFGRWCDLFRENFISAFDLSRAEDRRFGAHWHFLQIDNCVVAKFNGSLVRAARDHRQVKGDRDGDFALSINTGSTPWRLSQRNRERTVDPGQAVFYKLRAEAHEFRFQAENGWVGISLPEKELLARVPHAQDLVLAPLDPASPSLRYLQRYTGILFDQDDLHGDPNLSAFVRNTLFDLAALVLGARRDEAELAGMRGLRAARLVDILAAIKHGYSEPDFSPHVLAGKLGLSAKHIEKLLYATGRNFTERVLELRLENARAILADRRSSRLRVSDIAFACGFNEVSSFNRSFRRRYGETPTQWRGTRA